MLIVWASGTWAFGFEETESATGASRVGSRAAEALPDPTLHVLAPVEDAPACFDVGGAGTLEAPPFERPR